MCSTPGWFDGVTGFLEHLRSPFTLMKRMTPGGLCKVCNEKTLWKCVLCDKRLCAMMKEKFNGPKCVLHFQNDAYFGLTESDDRAMFGRKAVKKWEPPNGSKMRSNAKKVEVIKKKIAEEVGMIITV